MKRKKPAAVPAVEVEQAAPAAPLRENSPLDTVWVCLFSVMLFVSMTIQTGQMALILAVLALLLSVGKGPLRRLRERFCVPVLGLLAFALMNGLAAIYSSFGEYAIGEFYKIVASFSLAVILLVRFDKRHVRGLLWGVALVCALIGLLCIDAASFQGLFQVFNSLTESFGSSYTSILQGDGSSRVNGLYNDANISASILALGSIVALYLLDTAKTWKGRFVACLFLGVSAMGFFLAMSRGAIGFFALSLLIWLIARGKNHWQPLFLRMLFSAGTVVVLSAVAMGHLVKGSLIPDFLTVISGVVIFALDAALTKPVAGFISKHRKVLFIGGTVLVVGVVGYAVAASQVMEPYTFDEGQILIRGMDIPAGTYTISGDWDGGQETGVYIYTRTVEQELLDESVILYDGPLENAAFTVEEEGMRTYFRFWGPVGATMRQVQLSDGTNVPLKYKLLPSVLADRFQGGMLRGHSFLQRMQYDKDAWKIFLKSPLIGHGLGATEGLFTSVQPFFYESLYVHNHILQVMTDMGLLGLVCFLSLLVGSVWLLLRRLREERDPLAAALLACWVMMNTHSLMEINFSIRAYQCLAFLLLLLPVLLYAKPISEKVSKWGGIAVAGFIWVYLLVFGGLLESHRMVMREADEFSTTNIHEFMKTIESYVRRDVFDHEQNQLTYVGYAVKMNDSDYNGNMRRYAEELRASGTYTACSGLARYYYLPKGQFEELFACSREGIAQEASTNDAWNLQLNFYRNEVLPAAGVEHMDVFIEGVLALRDYLDEYSQGRLEEIELSEENAAFLNAVSSAKEAGMPNDGVYFYLTQVLGFGQTVVDTPQE